MHMEDILDPNSNWRSYPLRRWQSQASTMHSLSHHQIVGWTKSDKADRTTTEWWRGQSIISTKNGLRFRKRHFVTRRQWKSIPDENGGSLRSILDFLLADIIRGQIICHVYPKVAVLPSKLIEKSFNRRVKSFTTSVTDGSVYQKEQSK